MQVLQIYMRMDLQEQKTLAVSGEVNAKVGTANAEAGIYIGGRQTKDKKGQEINAYFGAEAMASAASGDASVGLVVLGHEVQVTVSGHAGSIWWICSRRL